MMPYTYLIRCVETDQVYYGVRYAKECDPSELWITYFTSSRHVLALIEKYGKDSFVFEIRKTFDSVDQARKWEHRVLRRLNVVDDPRWINRTDNISIKHDQFGKTWDEIYGPDRSSSMKKKISEKGLGRKHSEETKKKMSLSAMGHTRTAGKPRHRYTYIIEGVHYRNLEDIASAYGMNVTAVHYRVNTDSPRFSQWIKEK